MTGTYDVDALVETLYSDGIVALRGAFPPDWADRLGEDVDVLFREALARPDGAIGRGPNRYYVEVHPERIRGFPDLVSHPWVVDVARAVLGADYQVVEIGFDVPLPGAVAQPWHRDFPAPRETVEDRRLTSLAFNVTTVDTVPEMGPFEIAPGTQWDDGTEFDHGMFPPKSHYPRYEALARQKLPQRGDISARSALAIHRGTPNRSRSPRPVLVLGMVAAGVENDRNDLVVSRAYHDRLPGHIRAHLGCRVVDHLEPLVQKHTIEGLVMGAAD